MQDSLILPGLDRPTGVDGPRRDRLPSLSMRASRAKLVSLSVVTAGVVVLIVAAVAQKYQIRERWYLYRLGRAVESNDRSGYYRAVSRLGEVGSEAALVTIPFSARERKGMQLPPTEADACGKIISRIGDSRAIAALVKYVRDPAHDEMARILCTSMLFGTSRYVHHYGLDPYFKDNSSRELKEAKDAAIAACSQLFGSKDSEVKRLAIYFAWVLPAHERNRARDTQAR